MGSCLNSTIFCSRKLVLNISFHSWAVAPDTVILAPLVTSSTKEISPANFLPSRWNVDSLRGKHMVNHEGGGSLITPRDALERHALQSVL
jgi:hypothetical protein